MSAPRAAGQRKATLPKRFYKTAEVSEQEHEYAVLLDGRPTRTPGKKPLAFPNHVLAEASAEEWRAQGQVIDPTTMPFTRLANVAIDGVAAQPDAVAAEIVRYAGSDLVCYRAEGPERLVAKQSAQWDPILAFARDDLGARLLLSEGVTFVRQPPEAIEAVRRAIPADDAFSLAALSVVTTLTGSALIALALHRGRLTVDAAWAAANVDEDWNAELWGEDLEATVRKANRELEMQAAAKMIELTRG